MGLRLRQLALVARALQPAIDALARPFDLAVAHRDPSVAQWGLENALLRVGDQFLEIVAPTRAGTAAGRYLDRRGGDGGYMVILQCEDPAEHADWLRHFEALGVRRAFGFESDVYHCHQLHPADTGGSFLEVDRQAARADQRDPWFPAGADWERAPGGDRVDAIRAALLQSPAPERLARRWAEILRTELHDSAHGPTIRLANAELRFGPDEDGRGEGLAGIELRASAGAQLPVLETPLVGVRFSVVSA